jgi:hypothetical protein
MDENLYQAPKTQTPITGVIGGTREGLLSVARYQKGIIACIGIYLIVATLQFAFPPELRFFLGLAVLGVSLVGAVFTFLLSIRVYGIAIGILMGILALVPCAGLIVLLLINLRATKVLTQNGIRVGFFGADLSKI